MRISIVFLLLLTGLFALPAAAAAAGSCALTAAVRPGHSITVTGTDFPATTVADITQTWSGSNATAGGTSGPKTTTSQITSDANGGFEFTIDAGPGHGGTYDIDATAGGCSATTQVAAVETAGGLNPGTTGGTTATPPATDTAPLADRVTPLPPRADRGAARRRCVARPRLRHSANPGGLTDGGCRGA